MPEPFKNLFRPSGIQRLANALLKVYPEFNDEAFRARVLDGFESLELKARSRQIQAALADFLPSSFAQTAAIYDRFLDRLDGAAELPVDTWTLNPMAEHLGVVGVVDIERALGLMRRLTVHFTCEFGIRPLLEHDFDRCRAILETWLADPSEHVRRLVSEGTRPRLPWGAQLKFLIADPTPMLPLLEALKDDPSEYVRRSVANHLNDIGKDHPELLIDLAERWMSDASKNRQRLVRHACRSLFKAGDARALALQGWGPPGVKDLVLELKRDRVREGQYLEFALRFSSTKRGMQDLRLDYAVHFRKANGSLTPKVFCWKKISVAPGEAVRAERRVSFKTVTTRRLYPGAHRLDVRLNGKVMATVDFVLDAS